MRDFLIEAYEMRNEVKAIFINSIPCHISAPKMK